MNIYSLQFRTTSAGCFVPVSHRLNSDGYFRKRWPWGVEMFHRTIWRLHYGDIPEGYEIDHKCLNRACCNILHLQCLPGGVHASKGNSIRYASREAAACEYWVAKRCGIVELSRRFGVSYRTCYRWIAKWCALTLSPKEPSHA